ncbi:hypothetical protein DL769_007563 [Monosporascus sp. CRB-8-3]|nr:hypothetical protein DL769_007563 [Monosporascus sp. CRB-8-3]
MDLPPNSPSLILPSALILSTITLKKTVTLQGAMVTQTDGVAAEVAVGEKCESKAYQENLKEGQLKSRPFDDPFGKLVVLDDDSAYALVIRKIFAKKPE